MELKATRVSEIFNNSLYEDGEPTDDAILVNGLTINVGFDPKRIKPFEEEITALLMELPEAFRESSGGGWSFLQACQDKNGRQWGEHRNMQELFLLGMGIGKVNCLLPREMWPALPGGVPYYVILDKAS